MLTIVCGSKTVTVVFKGFNWNAWWCLIHILSGLLFLYLVIVFLHRVAPPSIFVYLFQDIYMLDSTLPTISFLPSFSHIEDLLFGVAFFKIRIN